jgi:predicted N-acetyltransferase YhbS
MNIVYELNPTITADEFIDVLNRSTLGLRRPVDDRECMQGMLDHANLLVTARADGLLVGVARSVTDFCFCCYLSCLAVDEKYQKKGIGTELIRKTHAQLGKKCTLILLSAPAAVDYYPHIGFEHHPQCWIIKPGSTI